jgi:methylenetetrahydrofolate dehydrogenase (NADP+)/methenyltetrahydrofolate cyclohydrolase
MAAKIIDGKAVSQGIRQKIKQYVKEFTAGFGFEPGLAVVLAGEDGASKVYVRNKIKGCEETGIKSFAYYLPENVSQKEIIDLIKTLNGDDKVHGILVQLPLPSGIDEEEVLSHIDYRKDVDGFHAVNTGNLLLGRDTIYPCTPSGCIVLLKYEGIQIEGKHAVVVGRSNIVGKPLALMLLKENATVTICHSKTKNLKEICRGADILCAAVGRAKFITADMVSDGCAVIDIGMNRLDGKLCGDVDFENVKEKASFITPVPGGVGPMTITMLLSNTLKAAKTQCIK